MSAKLTCPTILVFVLGLLLTSAGHAADPSLIGWWKLDETSGTVAHDASGRGKDGTLRGDPMWVPGRIDGALLFDGEDDYVEIGSVGISGTDRRTMAGWARASTTEIAEETGVFGFLPDGSTDGTYYSVEVDNAGNYVASAHGWAGIFGPVDTEWHHFAVTYEGDEGRWYLDGQLIDVSTGELGTIDQVRIGANLDVAKYFAGLVDDVRIYNRALTETEIQAVISGADLGLATEPSPAEGAEDVPLDVTLGWVRDAAAVTHDVYIGANREDVMGASTTNPMNVLASQGQAGATFDAGGPLEYSQTYYWRVDGIGAAPGRAISKGRVWSFSTEPLAYPIEAISATSNAASDADEGPVNTINGSGLNESDQHSNEAEDMWLGTGNGVDAVWIQYAFDRVYKLHEMLVWNYNEEFELILNYGVKNAAIAYSANGVDWASLGDVEFAQGTASDGYTYSTTVDFGGVAARYVRLTVNGGFGTAARHGLSEVRFLTIPAHARKPQPADGAVEVDIDTDLSWRAGREAASHEVYFDTDESVVLEGAAPVDTVSDSRYVPGDLEFGGVYYWRVDEVNEAEAVSVWEGSLWSFTVQTYAAIDDFESYTDDDGSRIYETWIDGLDVAGNGSQVGHMESPFAERTTVSGGHQSMPLFYDNGGGAISEAVRTLTPARDLTVGGANSLRLYFHGDEANTATPLYLALEDAAGGTAVVTHPDAGAALVANWQIWTISFSDLAGVDLGRIKTVSIGLGDRANTAAGGAGVIYIDDIGFGHATGLRR